MWNITEIASLLLEFEELFAEMLSTIIGHKAVVHLIEGAVPKLYSARPIPFPMKQDILETVDTTKNPIEWASPLYVLQRVVEFASVWILK